MTNQYYATLKTAFKVITFIPFSIITAVAFGILFIGKIVFILLRYVFQKKRAQVGYHDNLQIDKGVAFPSYSSAAEDITFTSTIPMEDKNKEVA